MFQACLTFYPPLVEDGAYYDWLFDFPEKHILNDTKTVNLSK